MQQFKRILLAEDNENDIELTLSALAGGNLANRVDVVRDGEEVLDYLYCREAYATRRTGDPVVVLLDLKMPKMDGLEVLERIKKDERKKQLPVVMVTSSRQERDLVESYRRGANAYVVKPVGLEEFFTAIRQIGIFWAVINEPPPRR